MSLVRHIVYNVDFVTRTITLYEFDSGSFNEFYYCSIFASKSKKNRKVKEVHLKFVQDSSNPGSIILKKNVLLSFDEFFQQ